MNQQFDIYYKSTLPLHEELEKIAKRQDKGRYLNSLGFIYAGNIPREHEGVTGVINMMRKDNILVGVFCCEDEKFCPHSINLIEE